MTKSRLIRKYSNRKLYCTETSGYVTLNQIAHFIKSGEEIKVEHHKSKEDLTNDVIKGALCTLNIDTPTLLKLIKQ